MEDIRSVQMDGDELAEFLAPGGTGVISFAEGTDEPPLTLPVSYGYDATEGVFYFRLAVEESGGKAHHVEGGPVSFVTQRRSEGSWHSAVATGELTPIDEVDVASGVLEGLRRVHIPIVDVFDRDPREVTFGFYLLDPDQLTGRKEALSDD